METNNLQEHYNCYSLHAVIPIGGFWRSAYLDITPGCYQYHLKSLSLNHRAPEPEYTERRKGVFSHRREEENYYMKAKKIMARR